MTIKIKAKQIGIDKLIEVKSTVAKQELADGILIKLLELQVEGEKAEVSGKEPTQVDMIKNLKQETSFTKSAFEFLQNVLRLSDQQVVKAKDTIDFIELGEYLSYVIGRLKGQSDKQLELATKKQEKELDPKKD